MANAARSAADGLDGMFDGPAHGMSQSLGELDNRIARRLRRVKTCPGIRAWDQLRDLHEQFGDEPSACVHLCERYTQPVGTHL